MPSPCSTPPISNGVVPGGHTPWHYHPGAHVVAVVAGTVTVLETDCVPRGEFTKGQGFFDPGSDKPRHIHMLYNSGTSMRRSSSPTSVSRVSY